MNIFVIKEWLAYILKNLIIFKYFATLKGWDCSWNEYIPTACALLQTLHINITNRELNSNLLCYHNFFHKIIFICGLVDDFVKLKVCKLTKAYPKMPPQQTVKKNVWSSAFSNSSSSFDGVRYLCIWKPWSRKSSMKASRSFLCKASSNSFLSTCNQAGSEFNWFSIWKFQQIKQRRTELQGKHSSTIQCEILMMKVSMTM